MTKSALDQFVETLLTREGQATESRVVPPPSATIETVLTMPLDRFEREGAPMEIRVHWFDETLWFVPSAAEAEGLVKEGVHRGRIWTAQELRDLLAIPGVMREQVKQVAMAKAIFEGTVTA